VSIAAAAGQPGSNATVLPTHHFTAFGREFSIDIAAEASAKSGDAEAASKIGAREQSARGWFVSCCQRRWLVAGNANLRPGPRRKNT
jgi:hypothetical protein